MDHPLTDDKETGVPARVQGRYSSADWWKWETGNCTKILVGWEEIPDTPKKVARVRIKRGVLAEEIEVVALKVEEAGQVRAKEDDLAANAPEEFLDPIMSHLMTDPVILPSSKLTCDRQTIARHLLSDQSDPFNRQPLTMEEVIPNTELKQKINAWLEEQRSKRREKSKASET